MLLKSKCKSVLAITLISASCLVFLEPTNTYAQENNTKGVVAEKSQDLSSIISDIQIENRDNLYMNKGAKISLEVKDENVSSILVGSKEVLIGGKTYNTLERDINGRFRGSIYYAAQETEYKYQPQKITIKYKNGQETVFNRNSSNEKTFQQFDFDVKLDSFKDFYIENKDNLYTDDEVNFSLKLGGKYNSTSACPKLTLVYQSESNKYSVINLYYKEKEDIFEGKGTFDTAGNLKLKYVYIQDDTLYIDKSSLKDTSVYVKQAPETFKEIKILNKKDIDKSSDMTIRATVNRPEKIDKILVKYDGSSYGRNIIEFELTKKTGDVFEATGEVPKDRKFYKFDKIEVYKTDGKIENITDVPKNSNLRIDTDINNIGWKKSSNGYYWYYLDENEIPVKGWLKDADKWYYLGEDGKMQIGWKKLDGTWYYLDGSGAMATGWKKLNGTWYYLKHSGAMATDWQEINGSWYYLQDNGAMLTGWKKNSSGSWYYLKPNGEMAREWEKVNGKWYYLGTKGVMQTGWQKIYGERYYMYQSGAMAANTVIDGWRINSSGVATKIK
ncbi:hypothetical protein [Romboutsia lituseburensis]|uniref:hypothetical protein n=1 Tax=Romboutsia lituseburensis TaxID=1537 RepID=UPI0022EAE684|nr:hypothetical protein [Romboutsia lituseburensis]